MDGYMQGRIDDRHNESMTNPNDATALQNGSLPPIDLGAWRPLMIKNGWLFQPPVLHQAAGCIAIVAMAMTMAPQLQACASYLLLASWQPGKLQLNRRCAFNPAAASVMTWGAVMRLSHFQLLPADVQPTSAAQLGAGAMGPACLALSQCQSACSLRWHESRGHQQDQAFASVLLAPSRVKLITNSLEWHSQPIQPGHNSTACGQPQTRTRNIRDKTEGRKTDGWGE